MRRMLLTVSLLTFVISLFFPPLFFNGKEVLMINVVTLGALGIVHGEVRWYANVFYLLALLLCIANSRTSAGAFFCFTIAALISLSCLVWPARIMQDTAVVTASLGTGAYLWISAMVIGWIGNVIGKEERGHD